MTFHTYNPSTDTLEVGREVKIAGRVGLIMDLAGVPFTCIVRFFNETSLEDAFVLNTTLFTDFEIEDLPAKPLTIDKKVKEEIIEIIQDDDIYPSDALIAIHAYLDSLEET